VSPYHSVSFRAISVRAAAWKLMNNGSPCEYFND
jgi:hypothetical protein